tara:strand:- start:14587 stop:15660 length:1074 start_codon:yes stop_codon:yes gene_type:complete
MSLARNLSKFKPSSSGLVETADIADDAVTTAKVNPAQTDITSVGTLGTLKIGSNNKDTTTDLELTSEPVIKAASNLFLNGATHNFYTHTSGASTGGIGSSTPRMSIDANGRVAIMDSSNTGVVQNDASNLTVNCDNSGGLLINNVGQTNGEFSKLLFASHATNTAYPKQGIGVKRASDYGVGDMVFAVDSNADANDVDFTADAKMTISQAGYVTKPLQPRMSNYKYSSQSIPHNTLTPIQYNGTNWTNNIQGITSSNTHSRYTVPVSGWYFLHATIYWGNVVVTGAMITVHINGSYKAYTYNQSMPVYTMLQVTHSLYLQANDYFEFMGYQHNGSNLSTVADSNGEGSMFATAYLLG